MAERGLELTPSAACVGCEAMPVRSDVAGDGGREELRRITIHFRWPNPGEHVPRTRPAVQSACPLQPLSIHTSVRCSATQGPDVQREPANEIVAGMLAGFTQPAIDADGVATQRLDAREVDERLDVPAIQLDDADERVAGFDRGATAQRIQMIQRLAEPEPRISVGWVVDREA